ncbi:MAG: sugar phosphate isomerase/epimerase [Phycisphaerae bacterium]|nr:sugar phosphate isomerase/epimerase [Phycisphaerae bacterium]
MMRPGLVSVTFKHRPCEDVICYAHKAQLKSIEWHGQNHVPPGDLEIAHRIGQRTLDAGLAVAAYGSYYVLGQSEGQGLSFATVLQTAEALGAPMIRVWAGHQNPEETPQGTRATIFEETRRVADLATEKGIKVIFEFHDNTLTQTGQSCAALLGDLDHPNVGTYWQPVPEMDVNENLTQLRCVLPWLMGLHVFHWGPTHKDRHALAQGESDWVQYLAMAGQCHDMLNVLLEFVKGGTVEQFNEDAATLHRLLV